MELNFGNLGFGFLRLPLLDPDDCTAVDLPAVKEMVDLFLDTPFEGGRHQIRIDKVAAIERGQHAQ